MSTVGFPELVRFANLAIRVPEGKDPGSQNSLLIEHQFLDILLET